MPLFTLLTDLSACYINHHFDYLHWMEPSSSCCSLILFKQLVNHKIGATYNTVPNVSNNVYYPHNFVSCPAPNPRSKITAAVIVTCFAPLAKNEMDLRRETLHTSFVPLVKNEVRASARARTHTQYNPWNAVYRLASGKQQNKTTLSTLKTPNGTYTTDIESTVNQMMDHFIPEDNESRNTAISECATDRTAKLLHCVERLTHTKRHCI
jgi:hypothetical protein